jgi:hypothetical protein
MAFFGVFACFCQMLRHPMDKWHSTAEALALALVCLGSDSGPTFWCQNNYRSLRTFAP